jgi:tetratricopeptide (TPR) repeat protein
MLQAMLQTMLPTIQRLTRSRRAGPLLAGCTAAVVALALAVGPAPAHADGYVISSGGLARECFISARLGHLSETSIRQCSEALEKDPLDTRDRAGTFINRGTLRLHQKAWALALADFDAAIALAPGIGEGHVNRAAALIGLARPAEAVAAADRGIALNPSELHKAYFNRATARELTGDVEGAYRDYTHATELAPDWDAPKLELKRFTVKPK